MGNTVQQDSMYLMKPKVNVKLGQNRVIAQEEEEKYMKVYIATPEFQKNASL